MTQFIVFTGLIPDLSEFPGLRAVPLQDDNVSEYVGNAIASNLLNQSWVLRGRDGEPGDELCCEAMIPTQEFGCIKNTELGKLLTYYIPQAKAITFFYGADTSHLIKFKNENDFLEHITECLSGKTETPLKIYAIYDAVSE